MKNTPERFPKEKMDVQHLFLRIRSKYPTLTRASKKIADYILANYTETKYLSISSLAQQINVSESMITKFTRGLGFRGFQEFKICLALSPEKGESDSMIYGEVSLDDDVVSICNKIYKNNMEALRDSLSVLDFKNMERAADLIVKARKVDLYGSGSSTVPIVNAQMRLYRLGIMCFTYSDSHKQLVAASLLGKKDVAIGISNSGRSVDIVNALGIAKQAGASTICITNYEETPITKHSDIKLFTSTRDSEELSESLHSRIAELSLLDSLFVIVASKMRTRALANLKSTAEVIRTHRLINI